MNFGKKCEFKEKNVNFVKYVNFRKNVIFEKCELR